MVKQVQATAGVSVLNNKLAATTKAKATDNTFTSMVITVPNKEARIPARPGCARAKRWQLLVSKCNGKTVGDYYTLCREAGIPCTRNNPERAVEKGLITLAAPKS
jgi:hypothetical protein|tara:strand:- start:7336 stop:7650 length:315 start_codon:yes stop_codon:yes gene_type:complete